MEMIERYIYAVTQRLPQTQREEISRELRGLIEDMLEERTGRKEPSKSDVESVLLELGDPVEMSVKYGGAKRYLVGPELFHTYKTILKIVLLAITISMSVVFVIETFMSPASVLEHLLKFFGISINAGAQAFAWVTIGFAIAEQKGNTASLKKKVWSPSDLPPVPDRSKAIKRSEAIVGIVFSIIGLVFILFSNHLIGVYIIEGDNPIVIPFLNAEAVANFLPLIVFIVALGVLKECLKLIVGKWTMKLAIYNLLLNGMTLILLTWLLNDQSIWNPGFLHELTQYSDLNPQDEAYLTVEQIWDQAGRGIIIGFTIVLIIDTITAFTKALKK